MKLETIHIITLLHYCLFYLLFDLPSYRPAFVIIISVPISWNRFHRSDPCRSTRVSSPVPVTGAAHTAAGCGLSSSASSLSAAPEKRGEINNVLLTVAQTSRLSVTHWKVLLLEAFFTKIQTTIHFKNAQTERWTPCYRIRSDQERYKCIKTRF